MGETGNAVANFVDKKTLEVNGIKPDGSMGKVKYNFDRCFPSETMQNAMFDEAVEPIVADVMNGFNGTVFAYGQTSSGKTHTMMGPDMNDKVNRGVIPRMVSYVFNCIEKAPEEIEF